LEKGSRKGAKLATGRVADDLFHPGIPKNVVCAKIVLSSFINLWRALRLGVSFVDSTSYGLTVTILVVLGRRQGCSEGAS
jgi:hypothetical protein